jgi:hypothetical protein
MTKYCLVPELANKFKKLLKEGKINPEELAAMTSEERRKFFTGFLGENNAKNVNTLFERKLLQKNKWKGMISWAKEVGGIKPEVRRDLVSKIERMVADTKGNVLDPAAEEAFLKDLASSKLGLDVTYGEAQEITRLSNEISKAKEAAGDFTDFQKRVDYGNKIIDMYDYTATLKPPLSRGEQIANVANVPRAIMATADISAPGRQGWGVIGRKQFWKNLKPMVQSFTSEKAYRKIQADIITRPNYISMKRSGLRLTSLGDNLSQREEAFMTNLLDKVPGVRGSERAYTGFLSKLRADLYDDFLRKAQLAGEDIAVGSQTTKDIATVVNNFTGAGRMGKADQSAPILNAFFFSPRKIAATVNMFNPTNYLDPRISPTARKEAIKNLIGMLGASASVMGMSRMAGFEVELNPTSSDFGKIKIGNTRIDVTGGNASYITLLARLLTNKTKSTMTELSRDLGGGKFGAMTRYDVLLKFFRNKLSPVASFFADMWDESDAIGKPFKAKKAVINRLMPIIMSSTIETMMEGDTKGAAIAALFDFFGFGGNTYDASEDWNDKDTKAMLQLKNEIGQEAFDEKNEEFNEKYISKLNEIQSDPVYMEMSDTEKADDIARWKSNIKKEVIDGQTRKKTIRLIEKNRKKKIKEREEVEENIQTKLSYDGEGDFVDGIKVYAKAFGTDPITAFNRVFHGEVLRRIDNGTIIVHRGKSTKSGEQRDFSVEERKERGATEKVILDHTISLQLGGSNSDDNLVLVPKDVWKAYTPKENELGRKLRAGEITKKEAQRQILDFKENFVVMQEVKKIKSLPKEKRRKAVVSLMKVLTDEEIERSFGEKWLLENL